MLFVASTNTPVPLLNVGVTPSLYFNLSVNGGKEGSGPGPGSLLPLNHTGIAFGALSTILTCIEFSGLSPLFVSFQTGIEFSGLVPIELESHTEIAFSGLVSPETSYTFILDIQTTSHPKIDHCSHSKQEHMCYLCLLDLEEVHHHL